MNGFHNQCIESKVHAEKAKSGGCLTYCVGQPEKKQGGYMDSATIQPSD